MNHTLTGIQAAYGAFQQAQGFASDLATVIDSKLRENAQIQARNAQLQYEQDAATYLKNLENSNDYSNWEQKTNDFLTQYSNKLQSTAKNEYTAKLLQDQMDVNAKNMSINVMNAANRGMQKEAKVEYNKNLQLIKDNYQGQERVDLIMQNLNEQYQKGLIDRSEYETMARQECMGASVDHLVTQSNDIVNNAVTKGMDVYELSAELDKMTDAELSYFTMKNVSGSEGEVVINGGKQELTKEERAAMKAKVIEQAKQNYELKVKQLQGNNHNKLAEIYFNMNDYPLGSIERENLKTQGRALMDQLYEGNRLNMSGADLVTFSERFRPDKDKGTASTGSGSGSGGGKKGGTGTPKKPANAYHQPYRVDENGNVTEESWNKEKYFDNCGIKNCLSDDLKIARDSGTEYTVHELMDATKGRVDEFCKMDGLSKEQAAEVYDSARQYIIDNAFTVFAKNNPKVENAINRVKTLCKKLPEELRDDAEKRVLDLCYDQSLNNLDPEEVSKKVFAVESAIQANNLKIMQRDKNLEGTLKGKDSIKALYEVSQTHLIQSDQQGRDFFVPGVNQNIKTIDNFVTNELSKVTGLPASSFVGAWEKDNKHDYTQFREYQTEDGTAYRIIPQKNGDFKIEVSVMPGHWSDLSQAQNNKARKQAADNKAKVEQQNAQKLVKETKEDEKAVRDSINETKKLDYAEMVKTVQFRETIETPWQWLGQGLKEALREQGIRPEVWDQNKNSRKEYLMKSEDIQKLVLAQDPTQLNSWKNK